MHGATIKICVLKLYPWALNTEAEVHKFSKNLEATSELRYTSPRSAYKSAVTRAPRCYMALSDTQQRCHLPL